MILFLIFSASTCRQAISATVAYQLPFSFFIVEKKELKDS